MSRSKSRGLRTFCLIAASMLTSFPSVIAEEPYERFLTRLRDERLFDLALSYLDNLESQPGIDRSFKENFELERAILLYQSASTLPPQSPERVEKLDRAEESLRSFLDRMKDHPRRGEARLKLGELLLERAALAKDNSSAAEGAEVPEAVKFYDEAHKLFEATVTELASILEQLKGNNISLADAQKVDMRQRIQSDIRQAQLLSAKAVDDRGRSRAADNPQRTADLEQALNMLTDLYSKEQRMVGIRNYALFYRSMIQADLGRLDDAIDGFQRVADLEGIDLLRPLQTDAITELIQLLAKDGKYPVAVDRADKWLKGLRPDERTTSETMRLQLAFAKLRLEWADKLNSSDPDDRTAKSLIRDTRTDLRNLLRTSGPHIAETREILGKLGLDQSDDSADELPDVKDFASAFTEARKRILKAETDSAAGDVDEEAQAAINTTWQQSADLLRSALALFGSEDDIGDLFEARFLTGFVALKLNRPLDSLAVTEFLSRSSPGTDQGMRAASVALNSFSKLLAAPGADEVAIGQQLAPFAEFLIASWPEAPEAAGAAAAVAQIAVGAKDFDKAEKYLNLVPDSSSSVGLQRRLLGTSFYRQYVQERRTQGEETEEVLALRDRALKWLRLGTENLTIETHDEGSIDSLNQLARLALNLGDVDQAAQLILDPDTGALSVITAKPDLAGARTKMESFRTAIQIVANQIASGSVDADAAVKSMQKYVGDLQALAQEAPEGEAILSDIFLQLARDLKDTLTETKEALPRKRLSEAVLLVVKEAGKSDSFNTKYWAGSTIVSMADELAESSDTQAMAKKSFDDAVVLFDDILARSAQDPSWLPNENWKIAIRKTQATAQRGAGDYQAAVLSLGEILDTNSSLLDIQVEAAKTLQAWGSVKPGFYQFACKGGRRSAKTGDNVIWGWGKIAQITANNPDFAEQFFEARYLLAFCRFKYARSLEDPKKKLEETQNAERDITSTYSLYPELGGASRKRQFETLLKTIQQELGKPSTGFAK